MKARVIGGLLATVLLGLTFSAVSWFWHVDQVTARGGARPSVGFTDLRSGMQFPLSSYRAYSTAPVRDVPRQPASENNEAGVRSLDLAKKAYLKKHHSKKGESDEKSTEATVSTTPHPDSPRPTGL